MYDEHDEPKWTPEDEADRGYSDEDAANELGIHLDVFLWLLEDIRRDSEYMYYDTDKINGSGLDLLHQKVESGEAREELVDKLTELGAARRQWHEAQLRLIQLVNVAYKFGIPVPEIADTVGLTRHGVYNILNNLRTKV